MASLQHTAGVPLTEEERQALIQNYGYREEGGAPMASAEPPAQKSTLKIDIAASPQKHVKNTSRR